jgi:hypothetical protein
LPVLALVRETLVLDTSGAGRVMLGVGSYFFMELKGGRNFKMRGFLTRFGAACLIPILILSTVPNLTARATLTEDIEQKVRLKKLKPIDPIEGVLRLFDKRPLVALDEGPHHTAQTHAFIRTLIQDPRFAHKVSHIVVEFGTARYQGVMDRYVAGEPVPLEQLRLVWRETTQVYVWDNPVYQQFFATVRAVNRKLPKRRQLRVLLGDPPIDWSRVNDFADWIRESPRDTHAAQVIEREVLKKGHKALIIYGGFGHLQRRDIYANFQPTPGGRAGLVEQVERTHPGTIYNIWSNTATDDLGAPESQKVKWPIPSLIMLKGTTLGVRDFTTILSPSSGPERRTKFVDGKRVTIPKSEYAPFKLEDNFDALLYLGSVKSMTKVPDAIDTYADEVYFREVVRRSKALNGFGLEEIEGLRRKYLERQKP